MADREGSKRAACPQVGGRSTVGAETNVPFQQFDGRAQSSASPEAIERRRRAATTVAPATLGRPPFPSWKDDDYPHGQVPPGRYENEVRAPIVWVLLCAGCAGFAPMTTPDYEGYLTGRCQGCGHRSRELHRFRAWIDTAPGCNCNGGHPQMHGDVTAKDNVTDEPQGRTYD